MHYVKQHVKSALTVANLWVQACISTELCLFARQITVCKMIALHTKLYFPPSLCI